MKFIYLASRNAALTPETFRSRWRRHGAMTTRRPSWRNMHFYLQADIISPPPITGFSELYDGFSMGQQAESFSVGPEEEPALEALARDELEIFAGPIAPRIILAEPEILVGGGNGITALLAFGDALQARDVATHYACEASLRRVVLNTVAGGSRDPVSCEAMVELCAPDRDVLAFALGAGDDAPWRAASLAIAAQEHLLWDTRNAVRPTSQEGSTS